MPTSPGPLRSRGRNTLTLRQRRHHYGLDRVHAVLRLGPHDCSLGFKHFVRYFYGLDAELLVDLLADLGVAVMEEGRLIFTGRYVTGTLKKHSN
jgi:hypothetical protein